MKEISAKFDIKSFIRMNIGLIVVALGLHVFLMPSDLAAGGVAGASMVIHKLVPRLPVGVIMLMFNAVLFVLAFMTLGSRFSGFTIYNSLMLSALISGLEIIMPISQPLVDNLSLSLVYGIVIQAVGMAIVFNEGASTGGTDIIAAIINKYISIDIGKALFMSDFIIAIGAALVFNLELGLYAFLGTIINSLVIDKVIAGVNTKVEMLIISTKQKEIQEYIAVDIYRGVTIIHGEGGFSGNPLKIINTVVSRREYIKIKKAAMEIDPQAFIWTNMVNEVHGHYR